MKIVLEIQILESAIIKPSVKKDDDQYEKVLAKTEPTSYQEINKTNDADVGGDQQDDDGMCIILPTYVNTY